MEITSQNQILVFFMCVVCGLLIGTIYDLFRIHRTIFKPRKYSIILGDCFFWLLTSFVSLQFIISFNSGNLRLFEFLGIIIGVFLYLAYLSKFCSKIVVFLYKLLNKLARFLLKVVLFPLVFFIKKMKKPCFLLIYGFKANLGRLKRFSKKI